MPAFVAAILLVFTGVAVAQSVDTSTTAEQRAAVLRLATDYPTHPQDPALDQEATAAANMLQAARDISVPICTDHLPWIEKKNYKYGHQLMVAYLLGSGAYSLQHAGTKPVTRLYLPGLLAGSQAAIQTYQSILQLDPKAKLDKMNDWSTRMQAGTFTAMLVKDCSPPNPAMSRGKDPVTVEEKQRIIALAEEMQKNPIDSALVPEYQELFIVVIQASGFTVEINMASTPWMDDKPEYRYGGELMALNVMAMASYVLQNPETGKSGFVHGRAGLVASLRGYEAILKQDPAAQSKSMEAALTAEKAGKLDDWYKERYAAKSSKKN
jgi:hypothetical protein